MVTLQISEGLARKLNELAARENRPVEEVLEALVKERATAIEATTEKLPAAMNPLLLIAQAAEAAGLRSGRSDIAERSRELLHTEIPESLMRRRKQDDE